jgi:tetratricopeptide (TPR) repeat protein
LKKMGVPPAECLAILETKLGLVEERDPLYLERVTLYNELKQPEKALEILLKRRFFPWEGLEGLIADQYALAHMLLGKQALEAGKPQEALTHFEAGWHFPLNLGAGRWCSVSDIPCQYYAGVALVRLGQQDAAQTVFKAIVSADDSDWSLGFLPALPYFKALALQQLDQQTPASQKLEKLLASASGELNNPNYPEMPNSQPFNLDSKKLNHIQQTYLIGLAQLGLGHHDEAQRAFQEVLVLDPYHPLIQ